MLCDDRFTSTPAGRFAQKAAIPAKACRVGQIDPKPPFDLWLHVFFRLARSQYITSGLTAFCATA
jgi:hypothetical protein